MRDLTLIPLQHDKIRPAFPLIRTVRPSLTFEDWVAYAERYMDDGSQRSGIVTLQDSGGLILGIFVYRVADNPGHGPTLMVEDFVALDIVTPHQVAERLATEMERLARQLGCAAVHTALACGDGMNAQFLLDKLHELGHCLESFRLCKPLPATGGVT